MLIDAANVDPFLEGRRPRHVWSHQLRLRATATATLADTGGGTNGNNNKNSNSSTISCLGPGGEQALFESLSSGAEGAFVAWVKGGHEMRQECKCLIVDVLDLLAAPGGQTLSYFQRGAQARRPPGGRVGIAAKVPPKAGTAAVTAGSPVVEKTTPGGGFVPSDVVDQNGIKRPTRLEEGEDIGEVGKPRTTVELADTAVEGFKGGPLGEKGGSPKNVRDTGCDGRKAAAAEGGQGAGLTYGYASLRKIREREPLPEVHSFERILQGREKYQKMWIALKKLDMKCEVLPTPLCAIRVAVSGTFTLSRFHAGLVISFIVGTEY